MITLEDSMLFKIKENAIAQNAAINFGINIEILEKLNPAFFKI